MTDPTNGVWTFSGRAGIEANASEDAIGAAIGQQSDSAVSSAGQAGYIQPGSTSIISETVTVPGGVYNVSFIWEAWIQEGGCPISVSLGGHVLFTGTPTLTSVFSPVSTAAVVLPAGTYTLAFSSTSESGFEATFIDTVAINPQSNYTAYTYDALDRLTTTVATDGTTVNYTYDAAGNRLTQAVQGGTQAPAITSAASTIFVIGQSNSFAVLATGVPAPTFSATGLPSWCTLDSVSGDLTGTPPNSTGAPFAISLTVSNGVSPNATQAFTLNLTASSFINFSEWEQQAGFLTSTQAATAAIGGEVASPENDGVPNVLKYVYDINLSRPMTATDRAALPVVGMTTITDITYLTLTYQEYKFLDPSVVVTVETSTDLVNWGTPMNSSYNIIGTAASGDYIMRAQVPLTAPTQFIRLNVLAP